MRINIKCEYSLYMNTLTINGEGIKPIVYKTVFMGDSSVGKTSLATRIACNTYTPCGEATIGASYFSKFIEKNNQQYHFNIWDTAGQEKYQCLVPLYYKNADSAIIVYDITNRTSFENAKLKAAELQKETDISVILFIGNKSDLIDDRRVSTKEANEYCKEHDFLFDETSAKLNINVQNMLQNMVEKFPPQEYRDFLLPIIPSEHTGWKSCC